MVDTPAPAPAPETGTPSGAAGFFQRETAGLPNWVWLLVIVAGLGVAVVIRHFANAASGTSSANAANDQAGIGGAIIDPSTGLPYGNPYGAYPAYYPPPYANPYTQAANGGIYTVHTVGPVPYSGTGSGGEFVPGASGGVSGPGIGALGATHVMASEHPQPGSTLASLADMHGTTLDSLVRLNPGLDPLPGAGTPVRIR